MANFTCLQTGGGACDCDDTHHAGGERPSRSSRSETIIGQEHAVHIKDDLQNFSDARLIGIPDDQPHDGLGYGSSNNEIRGTFGGIDSIVGQFPYVDQFTLYLFDSTASLFSDLSLPDHTLLLSDFDFAKILFEARTGPPGPNEGEQSYGSLSSLTGSFDPEGTLPELLPPKDKGFLISQNVPESSTLGLIGLGLLGLGAIRRRRWWNAHMIAAV